MKDAIVVYGEIEANTKKAILFKGHEMEEAVWLPRSVCEIEVFDDEVRVAVPSWLASKNGLEEPT